jgi:hypothetical protein
MCFMNRLRRKLMYMCTPRVKDKDHMTSFYCVCICHGEIATCALLHTGDNLTTMKRSGICYSRWNLKYLTLVFASSYEGVLLENHSVSLMLHQRKFLEHELKTSNRGVQKRIFANMLGMTIFKAGLQVTWTIHFSCSALELLSFFINFGWQYLKWNSSKSTSHSLCWQQWWLQVCI